MSSIFVLGSTQTSELNWAAEQSFMAPWHFIAWAICANLKMSLNHQLSPASWNTYLSQFPWQYLPWPTRRLSTDHPSFWKLAWVLQRASGSSPVAIGGVHSFSASFCFELLSGLKCYGSKPGGNATGLFRCFLAPSVCSKLNNYLQRVPKKTALPIKSFNPVIGIYLLTSM